MNILTHLMLVTTLKFSSKKLNSFSNSTSKLQSKLVAVDNYKKIENKISMKNKLKYVNTYSAVINTYTLSPLSLHQCRFIQIYRG